MLEIVEINELSSLAEYREAWDLLYAATPGANFFQSFSWLEVYWKFFSENQHFRVLVIKKNGTPLGFLPLVEKNITTRMGRLRLLTFPLDNWGSFYGPVGSEPGKILATSLEYLQKQPNRVDFFELRWIGRYEGEKDLYSEAFEQAKMPFYQTLWDQTSLVCFAGGWEAYKSSRKGKWLRQLRQAIEKLHQGHQVGYICYRPGGKATNEIDPRWDLYDACEAIAQKSWQADSPDGTTLSHETIRGFLREVHVAAAREGAVDLNLLYLDDQPAAFIYGYRHEGYAFGLRRGFDAEKSSLGLGNILLWMTLEESARRGDRLYDMGPGSLESKRYFQTDLTPTYRFSHFPPGASWRTWLMRWRRAWQARQEV